jgi:hypothetical protein
LSIRAELVEEIEGLCFKILVGGGIPCYLDGIFDLVREIYELGFNTGYCGVDSKTSTERGERNGGADLPESPWRLTLICETQTAK